MCVTILFGMTRVGLLPAHHLQPFDCRMHDLYSTMKQGHYQDGDISMSNMCRTPTFLEHVSDTLLSMSIIK